MSLRTEIHAAFDDVAPSTFGLPERVVQTVMSELPQRRRNERWFVRLRAPLSFVAVVLLLAMVVSVLVGGRLLQDWNAFTQTAPAGPSELQQLEARQMVLPSLKTGDPCPETPLNALPGGLFPSGLYGSGPIYIQGGTAVSDSWGTYWYVAAVTNASATHLVVVRAHDLLTGRSVIFVGNWAAGPWVGADTVNGKPEQQHVELVLDTRHPPQNTIRTGTFTWGFTAGLAKGASGCTGWQIDASGAPSEVIVTRSSPG